MEPSIFHRDGSKWIVAACCHCEACDSLRNPWNHWVPASGQGLVLAGASYPLEEEEERDMERDGKQGTEKRKSRGREVHGIGWQSLKLPCGLPIATLAPLPVMTF